MILHAGHTKHVRLLGNTSLAILKCSITRNENMRETGCCCPLSVIARNHLSVMVDFENSQRNVSQEGI